MTEAADLEGGLRAFFQAQQPITDLAPAGIHAGELNEDETPGMPRGALLIKSSGGFDTDGDSFVETATRRIDLFAFGATPREAGMLMATAALAFKQLRRGTYGNVLIYWAKSAGGQSSGREPVVEWPRAFQSFQIKYGLAAV